MYGDGTEDIVPKAYHSESFNHQSLSEKIAIVSAGPLMNLFFAFILFILLGTMGPPEVAPYIGDVDPQSTAYRVGLRNGDTIQKVNGTPVKYYEEFVKEISRLQNGANARLEVLRKNGTLENVLAPVVVEKSTNPISTLKNTGRIEGVNLLRKSSKVGIDYRSNLRSAGFSPLVEITSVNSTDVKTLYELEEAIKNTPSDQNLVLKAKNEEGKKVTAAVESNGQAWSLKTAGLVKAELMIGQVRRRSPAAKAGLKSGDQILKIDGTDLKEWGNLVETIKSKKKEESALLVVADKNGTRDVRVTPSRTELLTADGQVEYRPTIGVAPGLEYLPAKTLERSFESFSGILSYAKNQSIRWVRVTLIGFKKLFTGEVSHKTLSGVISIGKVAKDSLDIGWTYFVKMMAIISINLFLLNLFPIPVLDGGHLLFYFVEFVKGSPVSMRTRLIGMQIGVVLILSLVVYTIFNDFTRIVFSGW
jgi:regulator of sigma E protease